ncbi:M56 family metallopeptidase [Candidatus Allofournierella excrementigallinarum]|uniref:M56 family metallopeptidase n=1 Tax=Candidatus Allofournierella excrementigallinarum TaxID=2838592 RepID=UPI00374ED298
MRTLFLDYFAQSLVLGLAVLALLAAAPLLQKRYSARWFCRAWLALAVLLVLPLRVLLPQSAPAPVILTPPPALLAAEGPGEAPEPQAAVPGPGTEHLTAPDISSGQAAAPAPDQSAGQPVTPPETDYAAPEMPAPSSDGEVTVTVPPSPLAAFAPLDWLALLCLAGALGVAGWQWFAYFVWRRKTMRRALPADESWQTALNEALARQPLAKRPRLLASPDVTGAMAAGFLRPVLLVPESAQPGADGAYLLAHELAHLRRRDLARKALFSLVLALHWYNPAAWLLAKRAGRDMETACDEAALAVLGTEHRAAYCDALLHAVGHGRAPALTTCFSLTKRDVKARFARLWDTSPKRRGAAALAVFCLAAALAGALVACSTTPAESGEPDDGPPPSSSPAPDYSSDEEVWPVVCYTSNNAFNADPAGGGVLPAENFPEEFAEYDLFHGAGYVSPDLQRAGVAQPAGGDAPGELTLWNTADGGESWTSATLDCSAWLEDIAPAYNWGDQSYVDVTGVPVQVRAKHYQFVNENIGFVVIYAAWEGDEAAGRPAACSDGFAVLRTTDGGESWQRTGNIRCADAGNGSSFSLSVSSPFAFLNENVGFLCAHGPGYSPEGQFDLLRTVDGGASWQQLDLSEVAATLPGAPWSYPHVCGPLGYSTRYLPQEDLITSADEGFAAFSGWGDAGDTMADRVVFYTRDFGESWQWMYRYGDEMRAQYTESLIRSYASEEEVWPVAYYNSMGQEILPDEAKVNAVVKAGYISPDGLYAGMVPIPYERADPASLTLWNTADGGESWATATLDCSAWLEEVAEANNWASLEADGIADGSAWVMPSAYQFVNPSTGFLVYYGGWDYGPAHNRHTAHAPGFVVLRTTDGGESWQQMYSGDCSDFVGGTGEGLFLHTCQPFLFLNKNVGFLCAHGGDYGENGQFNLLRTLNGGQTWQLLDLSEAAATLPGAPWQKCHICGALGLGAQSTLWDPGLFDDAQPGFAAFVGWGDAGDAAADKVVFYTRDWGESWQWMYRYNDEIRAPASSASEEVNGQ